MIIYTTYKTSDTWYWTIHNTETLGTYQLMFDTDDKKTVLNLSGQNGIYAFYDLTALDFWRQLIELWADKDYHAFIKHTLQICEYVAPK